MRHFSNEEWLSYIKDEMEEPKREELENHLFSCDQCLEIYMELVESQAEELPALDNDRFTDEVTAKLPLQKEKLRKSFLQSPIFHYGVAAVVTLTLMSTGVFQSMTGIIGTVEASSFSEQKQSVSNHLMEKALSLFDIIETSHEEGEK
ncbi:anti-sigma factor family protein [Bacillus sp. 1P02SD]|uniref:anti-sigma factor family protein n=1 Tax=Bacillus sp. 1P02SD TaxID=3132264 RepID=UPI00399FA980